MDDIKTLVIPYIGKPETVALLKKGQNATIYSVDCGDKNYVVRDGYDEKQSGSSLSKAVKIQRILWDLGFKHCAEPVAYDEVHDVSIEKFLPGEQKPFSEYTRTELDRFITALTKLHQLDGSVFRDIKYLDPLDDIALYGTSRLDIVKEKLPNQEELTEFLDTELQKNILLLQQQTQKNTNPFLIHGDIGKNCIHQSNRAAFIDWEHARLSHNHELDYIKIHSHPDPEQFQYLVKQYATAMGLSIDDLYQQIKLSERTTRLNDVIWAAMRWSETYSEKSPHGGVSHRGNTFAELTHDRRQIFLNFIGTNYSAS